MIKDIHEFKRLFSLPIPYYKEYLYYLDLLMQSDEYHWLRDAFFEFAHYENLVGNIHNDRMQWQNELIEVIKSTEAYKKIMGEDSVSYYESIKSVGKITERTHHPHAFLSLDIREANYTVLRMFDDTLPMKWGVFCNNMKVPDIFIKSKYFRQVIFGNTSPKRFQAIQKSIIADAYYEIYKVSQLQPIEVHSDELIYYFDNPNSGVSIRSALAFAKLIEKEDKKIFSLFKPTVFLLSKSNNGYDNILVKEIIGGDLSVVYRKLYSVPGNRFYLNFKQHILGQPIDDRDLYFMNDKKLAKWVL